MKMDKRIFISDKIGPVYGNIAAGYIAGSGQYKSSPVQQRINPLLRSINDLQHEMVCLEHGTTLEKFKERKSLIELGKASRGPKTKEWHFENDELSAIESEFRDCILPNQFTTSGMTTQLIKQPIGMIIGDEVTTMFNDSGKEWASDVFEFISRLYDCDPSKKVTQARSVEIPENTYVTFLFMTTTYLYKLLTDSFFLQGTGNRILWVVEEAQQLEEKQVKKDRMGLDFFNADLKKINDRAKELAKKLSIIDKF